MRRFIIYMALCFAFLLSSSSLMAQERNRWEFGGRVNIYSGWNGLIGIGAYGRCGLTPNIRLEPSIMILCDEDSSMDLNMDLQFPFRVDHDVELYPLVGISLNDPGKLGLGANFGGGVGYQITPNLNLDFGLRYRIAAQKNYKNPTIISLGCGFNF